MYNNSISVHYFPPYIREYYTILFCLKHYNIRDVFIRESDYMIIIIVGIEGAGKSTISKI